MIEFLRGSLLYSSSQGVIVDVQGVGYGVEVNATTLSRLPTLGSEVKLWIYTHVKEDAIRLFGFETVSEKSLFDILLSISGVGPKLANVLVGSIGISKLVHAIHTQNQSELSGIPGVGPRLQEKIIVDLKPKLNKLRLIEASSNERASDNRKGAVSLFDGFDSEEKKVDLIFQDVVSALVNLGFQEKNIQNVLKEIRKLNVDVVDFQSILKLSLQKLRSPQVMDAFGSRI